MSLTLTQVGWIILPIFIVMTILIVAYLDYHNNRGGELTHEEVLEAINMDDTWDHRYP